VSIAITQRNQQSIWTELQFRSN